MIRAFVLGAMGCRIDPSWSGLIELFLVPASVIKLDETEIFGVSGDYNSLKVVRG